MKRIIAFVLLGLLIYAGGYVIYYASVDIRINTAVAKDLNDLNVNNTHTWTVVEGSVYQVMLEYDIKTTQPTFFGIPYGDPIEQHYFILPLGKSYMYMGIAVSDKHDLEIIRQLKIPEPRERAEGDLTLEIRGVADEMPKETLTNLKAFLINNFDLLGGGRTVLDIPTEPEVAHHIIPYIIHVRHTSGNEHVPLIIGIAMCLVGIGLAVLLIIRIKSEREGY